jgi:predicted DsbA family dithiol-disulfide isomerase
MSESTLAQRLSLKAYNTGGQDMQTLLVLALFKAHLQEAKDIGHVETISDIAEQNNVMSKDEVRQLLLPSFVKSSQWSPVHLRHCI